jgi:hypothetical protein
MGEMLESPVTCAAPRAPILTHKSALYGIDHPTSWESSTANWILGDSCYYLGRALCKMRMSARSPILSERSNSSRQLCAGS